MAERNSASAEIYPKSTRAFAYFFLFVSALSIFHNIYYVQQLDFISFWAASVLALQGNAPAAYDIQAHKAVQDGLHVFTSMMPFAYPPPFLLMLLPVGFLPYQAAAALWIVLTYFAYFFTAKRLLPNSGWLIAAFPPVLLNGIVGQNGFLTAALFIGGALCLERRPFLAGLILGCLIIKPQLGFLLPIAFVAGGQWRAFAGAAVSSVGLVLLALLAFGTEAYFGMAEIAPVFARIASEGLVGWHKMGSIYASLRLAGLPAGPAWGLQIVGAIAATATVWLVWRRPLDLRAKFAVLAAGSMLISPYIYVYDTVMLILPILWLVARGANRHLLIGLWLIPLVTILQSWGLNETVNLMPLLPIVLLTALLREAFPAPSAPAQEFEPRNEAKSLA